VIELITGGSSGEFSADRVLSEDALLRILAQIDPAAPFYERAAPLLDERIVRNRSSTPAATPRGPRRFLTLGMATYDDYDGVYFSVQAIRLYHPEVTDRTEILVLDNHPSGPCARALKDLEQQVAGYRYFPYGRAQGTAVRDAVFREANSEFVLCMDSHVLFRPGSLARLLSYLEAHPGSPDLWQGPLLGDDTKVSGTHFDPVWRGGMYGVWAIDPRGLDPGAPPFDIPMQGLGVFGCRRDAWPGFNPRLTGFGGEEGYIHEKVRRAGGRTLCLPFLGWMHRFNRPFGPRYTVSVEDRVRNYLLTHDELGLDPRSAIEHLEQEYGVEAVGRMVDRVERELRGPFHFFDAIYGVDRQDEGGSWAAFVRQCEALDIAHRLRRFAAVDTPARPDIGRALSHRAIVAEAAWQGLERVLVLEDDAVLSRRAAPVLARAITELGARRWDVLSLADDAGEVACGADALAPARGPMSLHAIVYHHAAYERMLAEVPHTPTAMARWLDAHGGLGRYYAERFQGTSLATCPALAVPSSRISAAPVPFDPVVAIP
jgi:hypothetical protein